MDPTLSAICDALDQLADAVAQHRPSEITFNEQFGWSYPALSRVDLQDIAIDLVHQIREAAVEKLEFEIAARLSDVPRRLQILTNQTVPQLAGTNSLQAVPAYLYTLDAIRLSLAPVIGWQKLRDDRLMPSRLARRLKAIDAEITALVPNLEQLKEHIHIIEQGHELSASLPTDIEALAEARTQINAIFSGCAESAKQIEEKVRLVASDFSKIQESAGAAEKLVSSCEEAYRITTTKGLAGAFDQRAGKLTLAMIWWTLGLLGALMGGAFLGAKRIELLSTALAGKDVQWGQVGLQIALSVLSVGAPLWFAWLATKQIGQLFRLSEDYAFKASTAKAYEGYRREAARIDPAMEDRLFEAALARLEEPPMRLVDAQTHGSPWHELVHELLGSGAIKRFADGGPEAKDKIHKLIDAVLDLAERGHKTRNEQGRGPGGQP